MFDDQIRHGLNELADGAPSTGDLQAIRGAGIRKRRARTTAITSGAAVVVLGLGFALIQILSVDSSQVSTDVANDETVTSQPNLSDNAQSPEPTAPIVGEDTDEAEDIQTDVGTDAEAEEENAQSGQSSTEASDDGASTNTTGTENTTDNPDNSSTSTESSPSTTTPDSTRPRQFTCQSNSIGTITWVDADQPKYGIYRSTDDGDTYRWIGRTLGQTTYIDPEFQPRYRYRLNHEQLADPIACSSDTTFVCRVDSVGVIRWTDDNSGPYHVERSVDDGATYEDLETNSNDTSYLAADHQSSHRYRVNAANLSNPKPCTTSNEFTCSVTAPGRIAWTDHNQVRYRIYRSTDGGETYKWLTGADSTTTFNDPDFEAGNLYSVDYDGLRPRVECRTP